MTDTLGHRAIIGVMTPAMNTVVEPELAALRPRGVTNQMQRFRLGGDRVSEDLSEEAAKLMDCKPSAIAVGLTTDAVVRGVDKLATRCSELSCELGTPVFNASEANHAALRELGANRIGVVTPFNAEVDAIVRVNTEAAGFDVLAIKRTESPSLEAICETPLESVRNVFCRVADADVDAILQVGTALPVVSLIERLEEELDKPIVACNAALYWQTLRALGIGDSLAGFVTLLRRH